MENIFFDPKYYSLSDNEKSIDTTSIEVLDTYDEDRQREELIKCGNDFGYFCHKYIKISHPVKGLCPFVLFSYQKEMVEQSEADRFTIVKKFRQGGVTTTYLIWFLWRALFRFDENVLILSKSDREAVYGSAVIRKAIQFLPKWLQPELSINNAHQMVFDQTGCHLCFYTPLASRGRSVDWLVFDEAAFIPHLDRHWNAIYPTIATGGKCIAISTTNGCGNWFEETYTRAIEGKNAFKVIDLDFNKHPDYSNPTWIEQVRKSLGDRGWRQEVLGEFLGKEKLEAKKEKKKEVVKKVIEVIHHHYIHIVKDS